MRKLLIALAIVTAALFWFMSPLPPDWPVTIHAQGGSSNYPTAFELLCPTVGAQPIGQFVTWNPNTQRWRANVCVDGSGNFSLGTGIASPAGTNTTVQFNNNGAFGANSGFTWNGSTLLVNPPGGTGALIVGQAGTGSNSSVTIGGVSATASITNDGTAAADLTFSTPIKYPTVVFASLGTVPAAGITKYCTDCTTAATCAGSGTGHLAVSNGTNWTCQ